ETTLHVSAAAVSGANPSDFSVQTTLPVAIPAGSTAGLLVAFRPGAVGARAAKITLGSDDPLAPSQDVPLLGTGGAPHLTVSPPMVDFGMVGVGTLSAPAPVTLTNGGAGPLSISAFMLVGGDAAQFRVVAPSLPIVIAPGGSRTVSPLFAPQAVGTA